MLKAGKDWENASCRRIARHLTKVNRIVVYLPALESRCIIYLCPKYSGVTLMPTIRFGQSPIKDYVNFNRNLKQVF